METFTASVKSKWLSRKEFTMLIYPEPEDIDEEDYEEFDEGGEG